MVDTAQWSLTGRPADVVDLRDPDALRGLTATYGRANPRVVAEVFGQAYTLGAQTAVVEYRYIDADYRNEHTRFYATTFRRYPSVAHRVHFFHEAPPAELTNELVPVKFAPLGYLGYAVMRPVPAAPVGRVVLAPPPHLVDHVTCLVEDTVNLLGESLTVKGAPFIAQDAQLLRCAHATIWVCGYVHHKRWQARRLLPSDIADAVPAGTGFGRSLPSPGLTINALSGANEAVGLPPVVYALDYLPPGESLFRIACRYLNGGMPVIVGGGGHAFVLVGYERTGAGSSDERIQFIRQDDEVGPYQVVPNFAFDDYSPWEYLVVPLPSKLYLTGEEAEVIGAARLRAAFERAGKPLDLAKTTFRTTPMLSNSFKLGLTDRGMAETESAVYRRMAMPKWVWVVEAIDRDLRRDRAPSVRGEAVIDATDHARDRHVIGWRTVTSISQWLPDLDEVRSRSGLPSAPCITSVGPGAG